MRELISASAPTSFVINLEHYYDEFRNYVGDDEEHDGYPVVSQQEIFTFIYRTLE
jgi:hypothetical protein